MSFSDWKINSNRVTTEEIKSALSTVCTALVLTRNIDKYDKFNKNTIEKLFAWGDSLANMVSKADNIQLNVVQSSMNTLGINIIDTNPGYLLSNPIEMILKVILSSPFLCTLKNCYEIIDESLNNSMKRLGEEKTIAISQEILKNIIDFRLLMNKSSHLKEQIDICDDGVLPIKPDNLSVISKADDILMGSDEDYLSFELLYSIYYGKVICLDRSVFDKVKVSAMKDQYTFQLLCNSLVLSPASIIQSLSIKLANNQTHYDSSHMKDSGQNPCDEIFINIFNVTSNTDVWAVVSDVLDHKFEFITSLSCAESDHAIQSLNGASCPLEVTILYLMLNKNVVFLPVLSDIICSKIVSDDAVSIEKYSDIFLVMRQYCYKTGGEAHQKYKHLEEKYKLVNTNM